MGEFKVFVEGDDIAIGVERALRVGGPALVKNLLYLKVGKAGTASREAYFYPVDYAITELDSLSVWGGFSGIGGYGKAEVIVHKALPH